MDTAEPNDLDQRFEDLNRVYDDFDKRCLFQSASRVARELGQLGRTNQRLIPYLHARFSLMNKAQGQLDPELGRDIAVELIALLESEERARTLQPEFPEAEYADTVAWMSACAYDNLAEHTAQIQGHNSEGMQACIREGIDVCRRTGKLRCVTCFREYATGVYTQADDLDMALHHSRLVQALPPQAEGSERRWVGAKDETWLWLLQGRLDAAEAAARHALELARSYHTPLEARLESEAALESILLLAGRHEPTAEPTPRPLPAGEYTHQDLRWDERDALQACCRRDFARAVELLTPWDRWLTEHQCLHEWFEVRLRLIAVHRLAGATERVEALARQLTSKARPACDWLTLRRLRRLLDPQETASPLALLGPLTDGPFAAPAVPLEVAAPPPVEASPVDLPTPASSPLEETIQQFVARLEQSTGDEATLEALLADVLAIPPGSVTQPLDAGRLIYLCHFLGGLARHGVAIWQWASAVARPFPQHAGVLNVLAALGDILRQQPDSPAAEHIEIEQIEKLFRQSLDLDADNPHSFARAGAYFLGCDNLDEAERCLARGFRLQRGNSFLALRLAEVYDRTERPRDALAVLDLCLRDGCDDPQVAWQAVLLAFRVDQYEALLTYLDRFEALRPGEPWVNYYRALALLERGQPEAAGAALDEEERRSPERPFPVAVLRACATAALGQDEPCHRQVEAVLACRLAEVDYLTLQGLADLTARLWNAVAAWPADDPLRGRLAARLLAAGLAPNELFDASRQEGEPVEGVNFYHCTVLQPLDDSWPQSDGCLPGQEAWPEYRMLWGVLAPDESEAERLVLDWQARCCTKPAVVEAMELAQEGFTEKPGVVWQGYRWAAEAEEEE